MTVARLLRDRGFDIVEPEVGELVTSLDMAGCSLTVMWLDDELEQYWTAPADTPAYKKGAADRGRSPGSARTDGDAEAATATPPSAELSDDEGRHGGAAGRRGLEAMAEMLADAEEELGRIDAVAGDGDHGRGMVKGSSAARDAAAKAVDDGAGQGSVLTAAGKEWAAKAGGTSGVLWGAMLSALGARLGDTGRPDSATVAAAMRDGYDALISSAGPRRETRPCSTRCCRSSRNSSDGWPTVNRGSRRGRRRRVATDAAHATAEMRPKVGRARPLAERSVGTPDAGATSLAMCAVTVADCFTLTPKGER